jgi:hypothetical protein
VCNSKQDLELGRLPLTETGYRAISNSFTALNLTLLDLTNHACDFEGRTWEEDEDVDNTHLEDYIDINNIKRKDLASLPGARRAWRFSDWAATY